MREVIAGWEPLREALDEIGPWWTRGRCVALPEGDA